MYPNLEYLLAKYSISPLFPEVQDPPCINRITPLCLSLVNSLLLLISHISGYYTGQWRYRTFLPLQDILLDSAGPDPTHSRCGSSVSAGSVLEGQNLSPSYGSTESPTGKDWGHGFFKYIFFLPQLLSFFWDSDYPYFRPSGFCSLDHPLSRPRPEDLFILFLLFPHSHIQSIKNVIRRHCIASKSIHIFPSSPTSHSTPFPRTFYFALE